MSRSTVALAALLLASAAAFVVCGRTDAGREVRSLQRADSLVVVAKREAAPVVAAATRGADTVRAVARRTTASTGAYRARRSGVRVVDSVVTTCPDSAGKVDTLSTAPALAALVTAADTVAAHADTLAVVSVAQADTSDRALAAQQAVIAAGDTARAAAVEVIALERAAGRKKALIGVAAGALAALLLGAVR